MRAPERHTLLIAPSGAVTLPDLTDELAGLAVALGAEPVERRPWRLGEPVLRRAAAVMLPVDGALEGLPEPVLQRWHARGAALFRRHETGHGAVRWTAVKHALAERLLGPACRLCARRCAVDRRLGERGFCGLGAAPRLSAPVALWGEEEELGRPGLGLPMIGCGLRCPFCYKAENLAPGAGRTADRLPAARGAEHLHFLGGNPDECLPAVLRLLAGDAPGVPLVWNTHSYLTPAQVVLLEGVVDAVVADLKFGPRGCGALAGVADYWPVATRALGLFARLGPPIIVRHVALPGHLECCAEPAAAWARARLPGARVRVLAQYEPLGAAADEAGLGRRLNEEERRRVANLGDDPPLGGEDR